MGLSPGEPRANRRRGFRMRGLAPVGDAFCSLWPSPNSISCVTPLCTFLHVIWCRRKSSSSDCMAFIFKSGFGTNSQRTTLKSWLMLRGDAHGACTSLLIHHFANCTSLGADSHAFSIHMGLLKSLISLTSLNKHSLENCIQ